MELTIFEPRLELFKFGLRRFFLCKLRERRGGGQKKKAKKGLGCRWPLKCFTRILLNDIMMLNIHFIHSFIYPFILSFIYPFILSSFHSFIHPPIYLFILIIYSFLPLSVFRRIRCLTF